MDERTDFEAAMAARKRYDVVRLYFRSRGRRTILRGLTEAEAQAHCSNPETSSSTATSAAARARTRRLGPWFDCYQEAK